MSHKLDRVDDGDGNAALCGPSSGAMRRHYGSHDLVSPCRASPRGTARGGETAEKIFFTVRDAADGRRYKIFVRPNDVSRLKVSKVRKTLSAVSGKPPFSFELLLGDEVLLGVEDVDCAALGITPQSVLLMRPSAGLKEEARPSPAVVTFNQRADSDINDPGDTSNVEPSTPHADSVLGEILGTTSDAPFAVHLNERQRALQAQLFEEAKRCHVFSTPGAGGSGKKSSANDNSHGGFLLNSVLTGKEPQFYDAPADHRARENVCCTDSFTGFIEEFVRNMSPEPSSGAVLTEPPHEQRRTRTSSHLDLLLQGEHYYNMCDHEDDGGAVLPSIPLRTELQTEKTTESVDDERDKTPLEGDLQTALTETTMACDVEAELTRLVENLRDDVSNLLSLQARNETIKQALQRDLLVSQRRVRELEKMEQQKSQQLDVLLLRLQRAHHVNGTPVFSENELRTALRNMAAVHHNELLVQENAALERRLAQEVRKRRDMVHTLEDMKGHIRVLVRVRPPCRLLYDPCAGAERVKETRNYGTKDEARMVADDKRNNITITDPHTGPRQFNFYRVFSSNSTQTEVFEEVAPLVQLACDGVNVSVVAYGQTGSGKTYTILGGERQQASTSREEEKTEEDDTYEEEEEDGIVPRAIRMLFRHLRAEAVAEAAVMPHGDNNDHDNEPFCLSSSMYEVSCSLVELYNDKAQDLLASPEVVVPTFHVSGTNVGEQRGSGQVTPQCSVKVGLDGLMYVVGLTQHVVRDARETLKVLRDGSLRRQVHATQQNSASSRSHLIFTVYLSQRRRIHLQKSGDRTPSSSIAFKRLESKLVFVDLAGSERVSKSHSVGERLVEARYINKSLSAFGDVVASLSSATSSAAGPPHVPYRNSTLTALLQDVVGSRSKTVLIACVSPSDPPYENHTAETTSTLQFVSRVRCVKNFIPPRPLAGEFDVPTKKPSVVVAEGDLNQTPTVSHAEQGRVKRSMQRTKSSRQRDSVTCRQ